MTDAPLLAITNLAVEFVTRRGALAAVRGIDLHVADGETLAVVGESGSGKSVSMMAALGLLPDNAQVSGSVRFGGRELVGMPEADLRTVRGREIGIVFQDPMSSLNPVHPVGRQIAETLRVHQGMSRSAATSRAVELLGEVGIPDAARRVGDYPHHFSGGMRQRVMIAMALACQPRLLIADEPTTALDVTVQAQIVELVQRLQAEHGMAVVWITHDLGVVAEMADRVTVMYGGRVVESGDCLRLYDAPAHPYTAGLLDAVPRLDSPADQPLVEIPGTPPDPMEPMSGCAFAPRCHLARPHCTTQRPALLPLQEDPSRQAACFHSDEMLAGRRLPPPELAAAEERRVDDTATPLLEVRDLQVHFGGGGLLHREPPIRAVDGVDLTILEGQAHGLVGESGSGKSTLGRAVMAIERVTSGRVAVLGIDVEASNRDAVRRRRRAAQMVFQDPASSMNPALTVGDVVAEPLRINRIGSRAQRRERTAELLRLVEMPQDCVDRHPHEFSGGQRQRIAIARALALEPRLLICDEAVSALDVSVQAQVVNLLSRLQAELGLGLLFIAHDLAIVRHLAQHVSVMYLGQIVETGPRDEVYERPRHPYTRALLEAVPVTDPTRRGGTRALGGDPPSAAHPPQGCRFSTRCPLAVPGLCDTTPPPVLSITATHQVACHRAEEPLLAEPPRHPAGALPADRTSPRR
ncbi:dipeptide ABC transporter ATP-binding protein [Quadrisphaera sp. GCM10027208]|uniref:ABC transporter ATP-binding protein n=1 Tax=Quadrisphaera sp. GCM10027208 TaxID=3273423 RepID=UPI00360D2B70